MATSLNIQIAYAKVGNVLKPLNKIVNVKYKWIQNDLELNVFFIKYFNLLNINFINLSVWTKSVQIK